MQRPLHGPARQAPTGREPTENSSKSSLSTISPVGSLPAALSTTQFGGPAFRDGSVSDRDNLACKIQLIADRLECDWCADSNLSELVESLLTLLSEIEKSRSNTLLSEALQISTDLFLLSLACEDPKLAERALTPLIFLLELHGKDNFADMLGEWRRGKYTIPIRLNKAKGFRALSIASTLMEWQRDGERCGDPIGVTLFDCQELNLESAWIASSLFASLPGFKGQLVRSTIEPGLGLGLFGSGFVGGESAHPAQVHRLQLGAQGPGITEGIFQIVGKIGQTSVDVDAGKKALLCLVPHEIARTLDLKQRQDIKAGLNSSLLSKTSDSLIGDPYFLNNDGISIWMEEGIEKQLREAFFAGVGFALVTKHPTEFEDVRDRLVTAYVSACSVAKLALSPRVRLSIDVDRDYSNGDFFEVISKEEELRLAFHRSLALYRIATCLEKALVYTPESSSIRAQGRRELHSITEYSKYELIRIGFQDVDARRLFSKIRKIVNQGIESFVGYQ